MKLRERFQRRLREKPKALALLDHLFINPYMSVARAERVLKVSNPTARQAVQVLEQKEMLEEITGRAWRRLYLARPILEVIEGPPERS